MFTPYGKLEDVTWLATDSGHESMSDESQVHPRRLKRNRAEEVEKRYDLAVLEFAREYLVVEMAASEVTLAFKHGNKHPSENFEIGCVNPIVVNNVKLRLQRSNSMKYKRAFEGARQQVAASNPSATDIDDLTITQGLLCVYALNRLPMY